MTFPSSFSVAGFARALGTDVLQLASRFLAKGIGPCIVILLGWCLHGKKEGLRPTILLDG